MSAALTELPTQTTASLGQFNSVQFHFIYIVSITVQIASRHFPGIQIMTPEQISLIKVILLNPNQRKMAGKKTHCRRKKKTLSQTETRKNSPWIRTWIIRRDLPDEDQLDKKRKENEDRTERGEHIHPCNIIFNKMYK